MSGRLTYKEAGVDTKEGERAVGLMKEHVRRTFDAGVLTGLGGFGSLYQPDLSGMSAPVFVAGTDGVGTKLMVAFLMDKHDTIGQDCVAMCVNDVLCQGAKPLFFLDYIATGRVAAEKIAQIVKGVADGCVLGECALVGGETAEMPGLYEENEYDLAGFCVGVVDKDRIVDGHDVEEGDRIIGIASSGLHSNGYSLARKVLFEIGGLAVTDAMLNVGAASCRPQTVGEVLLTPTRIYTKAVRAILGRTQPKAFVHITGGGFFENIPRVMPHGLGVRIEKSAWTPPPVFGAIAEIGGIDEKEMFSTFNMGIGLMAVVDAAAAEPVVEMLRAEGEDAAVIGEVALGSGVTLW
ncbi:MAG: phosphoribosylformylglycinamidine cyclo-ligase [Clostridiales Family XIII bacterium]|jgi:phosphoribosylformylglycinamidine cyclo-ligase|nr:phosphoribosylformylglycinamidine cyclo-ligase [Clostridiales Family XIII bacterium]